MLTQDVKLYIQKKNLGKLFSINTLKIKTYNFI